MAKICQQRMITDSNNQNHHAAYKTPKHQVKTIMIMIDNNNDNDNDNTKNRD